MRRGQEDSEQEPESRGRTPDRARGQRPSRMTRIAAEASGGSDGDDSSSSDEEQGGDGGESPAPRQRNRSRREDNREMDDVALGARRRGGQVGYAGVSYRGGDSVSAAAHPYSVALPTVHSATRAILKTLEVVLRTSPDDLPLANKHFKPAPPCCTTGRTT